MGRNVQLPAVHVYSQRGARGVRGAVFRDIAVLCCSVLNTRVQINRLLS